MKTTIESLQARALEILKMESQCPLDDVLRAELLELSDKLYTLGSRLPDNLPDTADPVGAAIADDAAERDGPLRFKQGKNADGGVTLARVQQVAQYAALKMALEAMRQTGNKVAVTVEIVPFGDRALNYIVTSDKGESVKLECSSTSFERLVQIAALIIAK